MSESKKLQNPIFVFPLPSTVFYPDTLLPLHIFESRYREMLKDALAEDRLIGMVLLKPGWESDYFGGPGVVSIGCAGKIDRSQLLEDGKYNIVLKGMSRFRIREEISGKPYRIAAVEFLDELDDEPVDFTQNGLAGKLVSRFENYLKLLPEDAKKHLPELNDCKILSSLVDRIAYRFDFKTAQKQSFLEELNVRKRVDTILSVLDLKTQIVKIARDNKEKEIDVGLN